MSSASGIVLMMNNYFHDVATAMLMASAFLVWIIIKRYDEAPRTDETTRYFRSIYTSATRCAKLSLLWIIAGGIPRTIFYTEFEWANAAGKSQVPALIVKHIMAFIFVGIGAHLWIKINGRVKEMKG